MTEFEPLWMAQPRQCGKLLQAMTELRRIYNERTEAYDQTICTRRTPNGVAVPANGAESKLINRNALAVREELLNEFCRAHDVSAARAYALWREAKSR